MEQTALQNDTIELNILENIDTSYLVNMNKIAQKVKFHRTYSSEHGVNYEWEPFPIPFIVVQHGREVKISNIGLAGILLGSDGGRRIVLDPAWCDEFHIDDDRINGYLTVYVVRDDYIQT
jgi:hypothetical protein